MWNLGPTFTDSRLCGASVLEKLDFNLEMTMFARALRPGVLILLAVALVEPGIPVAPLPGGTTFAVTGELSAQEPPEHPVVAASGRASTMVTFDGRLISGRWFRPSVSHSGPARFVVDYGQPHARGRDIFGGLVPYDEVWRLGANQATHLRTDVNLRIGELVVPRGSYTLYLIPRVNGGELVINRDTGQWGTEYDSGTDLGRVPVERRALAETEESLNITLAPVQPQPEGEPPSGLLRMAWGEAEYVVDWAVHWPE